MWMGLGWDRMDEWMVIIGHRSSKEATVLIIQERVVNGIKNVI